MDISETKVNPEKKNDKKDDPTALKNMRNDFTRERKSLAVDNKFKEKLNLIAVKLADDVSLKDKEVYLHSDIKAACSTEKERVCWKCAGINCYIKQQLCIKHKIKRQFVGRCQGKKATFGDLSKYGVANVQTPAHSATTIPKPSVNVDYDSDTAAYEELILGVSRNK